MAITSYTDVFKNVVFNDLEYQIKNKLDDNEWFETEDFEFNPNHIDEYIDKTIECIDDFYNDVPMTDDEAKIYCGSLKVYSVLADYVYEETNEYHPPLNTIQLAIYLYAKNNAQSFIENCIRYADASYEDDDDDEPM